MASYEGLQRVIKGEVSGVYEQFRYAITHAAMDVENEDPGTNNHDARLAWAKRWRRGQEEAPFDQYASMIMENAQLQNAVGGTPGNPTWDTVTNGDDNAVQFQVDSLVDRFAALGN